MLVHWNRIRQRQEMNILVAGGTDTTDDWRRGEAKSSTVVWIVKFFVSHVDIGQVRYGR